MKVLPIEYSERMKKLLGNEFQNYIKSLNKPPVKGFRVNTDKLSVQEFEKINIFSKEKISYVENGFYLDYDKIGNHPYHHAGMIYVQEPGAMAPAECIDISPDWKILDMCAAPGGKSTQLKNKLGKNGVLVSNEIIPSRCKILTGNIERLGLHNCVTTCMDTSRLAKTFPHTFDLVMCDAPCSGEGMFRKDDTAIDEWSISNVLMCAERQTEILENAAKLVCDGGYIIYATCTFSLEENEMVVDRFLKKHPEFELVPVKESVKNNTVDGIMFDGCECDKISFTRRFYPHKSKGEGQFMAVLHNTSEKQDNTVFLKQKKNKIDNMIKEFLDETLIGYDESYVLTYNGNPVYFTPDFEVPKGVAFCCGITIGEIKKNYILPHHQFFMGMEKYFRRKIDLSVDSEELKKYLHGEEFETNCKNGWAVVTVDGCAVGGVKVVNGRAKNHYPKGLRTK
ncbi:MAG: methyltransferase domain-containing protein [Clostridia bacterium]|nr:methyltransferase domain-containing protein [Clostridia bacterium]